MECDACPCAQGDGLSLPLTSGLQGVNFESLQATSVRFVLRLTPAFQTPVLAQWGLVGARAALHAWQHMMTWLVPSLPAHINVQYCYLPGLCSTVPTHDRHMRKLHTELASLRRLAACLWPQTPWRTAPRR